MKRANCLCALISLLPIILPAQTPPAAEVVIGKALLVEQRRKAHPEISKVVDLADSVPPEFSARFLLQAATSTQLHDRVWQKELLEQAFERANLAREPVRRRS